MNAATAAIARGHAGLVCALALSAAAALAARWPFAGGAMAGLALFGWLLAFGAHALRKVVSPGALAVLAALLALCAAALEAAGSFGLDAARAQAIAAPAGAFLLGLIAALLPAMLVAGRLPTLRLEP